MGDQVTTAILLVEDNQADIHLIQEGVTVSSG